MYILGYNSLTQIDGVPGKSRYAGSSSWRVKGDILYNKEFSTRPREIKGNIYNNYLQTLTYCDMLGIPYNTLKTDERARKIANYDKYIERYKELSTFIHGSEKSTKKTYKINKSKVRKKLTALCRLKKSKHFLAFYSISFPLKTDDKVIYKIFNKWLTNCRTRYGLKTYVWVAERQANNTLHFHILTNDRMDIRTVNKAMASSIQTCVNQGLAEWGSSSRTLYNGVDVDCVQKPKRRQGERTDQYKKRISAYKRHNVHERLSWATRYMTKYMTKGDVEFSHLPYHSSRDVSQLFTSIVLSDNDMENFLPLLSDDPHHYDIYQRDRLTIYSFKCIQSEKVYNLLDRMNNLLYEMYYGKESKPPD